MSEQFGGHEDLPPKPPSGEGGADEAPGYPPAGYEADQAARAAAEQADRAGEDPDAVLASLEGNTETSEQREARLGEFVLAHFADVCPPECVEAAAQECALYEDDCRMLFEEPDLQLSEADASDPTLRAAIETQIVAQAATIETNETTIAALEGERDVAAATLEAQETEVIPASEAELVAVQGENAQLEAGLATDEAANAEAAANTAAELQQEAEINRDLNTVRELQANFDELKAQHGTIGALEALLDEENGAQSPEMRAVVRRAINTARAVVMALPGREDAVEQLLNSSSLDLTAATSAGMFAGLLEAAEASDDFTQEEVTVLRRALGAGEVDVDTGGDVNELFATGIVEEYTDKDGNLQTRRRPMQPGDETDYKDGHRVGIDARGERYARIQTHVGLTFRTPLPNNPTDSDMGHIIRTAETRAMLHSINMAEPFYPQINFAEQGGGEMVIYPSDYIITERILGPLTGNRAIAGNNLLTQADIDQSLHLLQFANAKGDAAQGDINPEQMRADYRENGILEENGTINWDRYTEIMEANRNNLWIGEQNVNAAA